ncbi:MAG: cobaltochelatase CobN [Eubacteriaceae bacterium]|nr:cobaltochelatase CobN [Eubacteriaceae bacterium]MDK2961264.1 cobaltochelatase CobN [Eubacteriaceae bacterium]
MYRIAMIFSPMDNSYTMRQAVKNLGEETADIQVNFLNSYETDDDQEKRQKAYKILADADFIFIFIHGGLTQFKSFSEIMETFSDKRFFIWSGCDDENQLVLKKSNISLLEHSKIAQYALDPSDANCLNLFKYLGSVYGKLAIDYEEAVHSSWEGIYQRNGQKPLEEVLEEARKSAKPVIGILVYSRYMHEKNMAHIDALIDEVTVQGGFALPVYTASVPNPAVGCKGAHWVVDNILMQNGERIVDAIINTMGYSLSILSDPGDGSRTVEKSIFEPIDVPVIQGFSTYQTYEDWETNLRGIDAMSFPGSVYYPEFDGQIISFTFAYTKFIKDEIGDRRIHLPIADRVKSLCELAISWARLSHIENEDKKVAILFHNMPPRNDMIGCAFGLDTPKSVYDMVEAFKADGIQTEYEFVDGDDIINRIIDAVSNDERWLPAEKVIERSCEIITGDTYRSWFENFSGKNRTEMIRDWGNPPGEKMVHDDKLPVPGILNGNIFIGLQPPRGYEDKAEEVYHSSDIVPPHQYLSFYKWLKYGFKADVVIHVGTHGTLEWLPGKEIGLSESCYPDLAISGIPHLYPYSITVEGEGIQAKRRSYAVILDHLIPSLTLSDTYEEMEEVDDLLKQYYQAQATDTGKLPYLQQEIEEIVIKENYLLDLDIDKESMKADFKEFIEKLHIWVEEIKNTLIKDGLHLFGNAPKEEKLELMICALTRLSNGKVPSLTMATCDLMGFDYEDLKDNPEKVDGTGITNLMKWNDVERLSRKLIHDFYESGWDSTSTQAILVANNLKDRENAAIKQVFKFIEESVEPKVKRTTEEMEHLVKGINGQFVPPGGSGAPTRGKVSILPTGRNFYAIDPSAIPTRAAWQVGKQLGDQLIERYKKDKGEFPKTVAIVVYGGETMKTSGDDLAQILYLIGIRPKWLENSDKVIGLEVIPVKKLGRPRVDVTLRISGLFRDTFPNMIELVEEAINLAASQDESYEENFIKMNFEEEIRELIANGASIESAQEDAGMRIFSDPPGTYGAGVTQLINSKNWDSYTDLGEIYSFWGGNAYGKKFHGKKAVETFKRRLSKTQITVKNESSMEIDMLESDDFYNYHGGLIAGVRTASGQKPESYCGDTSDPLRVKMNTTKEQTAKIMRSRILNPKWFNGLKEHGYKGAQEISGMVDFVFGWDATSDIVEDWMYEKISENFLFNEERREWINSVNPWAIHAMTERLLEAAQREMWDAKEETLDKLKAIYMEIEGDIEEYSEG